MRRVLVVLGAACLVVAQLLGSGTVATAAVGYTVALHASDDLRIGEPIVLRASVMSQGGSPVRNAIVRVFDEFGVQRNAVTGQDGLGSVVFPAASSPGEYLYTAVTDVSAPSLQTRLRVAVRPAVLRLETVPPLPGVAFTLDGQTFETGHDGSGSIDLSSLGQRHLVVQSLPNTSGEQYSVARWQDGPFGEQRDIDVTGSQTLVVGLSVRHRVTLMFIDPKDEAIDAARIGEVTVRGSNGVVQKLTSPFEFWADTLATVRRLRSLGEQPITYTIDHVQIDGSNVVNRGQQRFDAGASRTWTIRTLVSGVTFRAYDSLLGTSVGAGVDVTYPDVRVQYFAFDGGGAVTLPQLARGDYEISVRGIRAVNPPTPIVVSRDQEVDIKLLTYWDLAILGGLGLVAAVGLLLIGRKHIFDRILDGATSRARRVRHTVPGQR